VDVFDVSPAGRCEPRRTVGVMSRPDFAALLDPAHVADVPAGELPALSMHLAALQAAVAARLHALVAERDGDDCECLSAEEVARLLQCSTDLVRERGEAWGIAKVLARDSRNRPSRVVYPRALLRAYLQATPGDRRGSLLDRLTPRGVT
jgi:hypothetical protein